MTPTRKLGAGIQISAEQAIPVFLLILCSFFKSFGLVLFDTGTTVAFLETFPTRIIPWLIVATSLVLFALYPLMLFLKNKSELMPAYAMFAAAAVAAMLYGVIVSSDLVSVVFTAALWREVMHVSVESAFLLLAFRFGLFHGQPKTLVSVLLAQAFGTLIAAGLLSLGGDNLSAPAWMMGAVVCIASAAVCAQAIIQNGSAPVSERLLFSKKDLQSSGADSKQRKLYFFFFCSAFLLFFSIGAFDGFFWTQAFDFARAQDKSLTGIFGQVYGIVGLLSLVFLNLLLARKVGSFPFLFLLPVALIVAAIGGEYSAFGAVVAARAAFLFIAGVNKENLFLIIPQAVSMRSFFRAAVERKFIVEPLGLLSAGVMLFYAQNTVVLLAVLGAAAAIAFWMLRQTYVKLVLNNLQNYLWRGGRLLITGKKIRTHLKRALNSATADEAIYALRVLEDALHPAFPHELRKALSHPMPEVRLFALEKVETLDFRSALKEVEHAAMTDKTPAVRRIALRTLCVLGTPETRETVVGLINNPDACEGALIGLLAVGREGVFAAIDKVAFLAASIDDEARQTAARVLGDAHNPAFYLPLIKLLNDEDPDVCRAAVIAAGKLREPHLLPALINSFRFPELREDAVDALLKYRETAFPEIDKVLNSKEYPHQFRSLLAQMLKHIDSPECRRFLFDHLFVTDRRVRFNILKSLVLLGFKAHGKDINNVRLSLYDEIEWSTNLLAALDKLEQNNDDASKKATDILAKALHSELDYSRERILLLLALLQPSELILDLLNRYAMTTDEERAAMANIVDKILSGELRQLCLPLFSSDSTEVKLAALRPHFYPPILSLQGYVHDILRSGENADWTRAAAVYALAFVGDKSSIDILVPLLKDRDPMIRETAVYVISKLLPPEEAARLLMPCLDDFSPAVARMAQFSLMFSKEI